MRKRSSNLLGGALVLLVFFVPGCLVSSPRKRAKLVIKPSASPSALSEINASFPPPPVTKLPVVATACASQPKTRDEEKAREAQEASEFAACDTSKKAELRQRLERINAELPHRRDWDPPAEAWGQVSALVKEGCFYRMRSYGGLNVNDFEKLECKEDGKNSLPALKAWWKSGGYRTLRSQLSAQPPIAYAPTMPRFFARETIRDPRLAPFLCSLADDSCPSPGVQGLLQAWGPYLNKWRQHGFITPADCIRRARRVENLETRWKEYAQCIGGMIDEKRVFAQGKFKNPQGWLVFYRGYNRHIPTVDTSIVSKKLENRHSACDEFQLFQISTGTFWQGKCCGPWRDEYADKVGFAVESDSIQSSEEHRVFLLKKGKVAVSYVQEVMFRRNALRFFDQAASALIVPLPENLKTLSLFREPLSGFCCGEDSGASKPIGFSNVAKLWFSMSEDGLLLENNAQESLGYSFEIPSGDNEDFLSEATHRLNRAVETAPNLPCSSVRFSLPPWSEVNDLKHPRYQAMWMLLQNHQTACP